MFSQGFGRARLERAFLMATIAWAVTPAGAWGQQVAAAGNTAETIERVVVTGSRFGGRVVAESPVPVDYIPLSELNIGGYSDLTQKLKANVPSFSTPHPSTAGSLDFTTVPTLRGLSPGQLLVLVNGKRRHSTGDLGTGVQIGRGDVAYDLNSIPTAAIGHIEVLRDGASAQYGADAIAGVLNVVLDNSMGMGGDASYGGYTAGDGRAFDADAYVGFPVANNGFVRMTVALQDHGLTDRSLPDTRQQYFGSNGTRTISNFFGSGTGLTPANGTLDPREATIDRHTFRYGDAPYRSKEIFANGEVPINSAVTFYSFGGYSRLRGVSYGFVRRAGQDETVRALFPDGYLPHVNLIMENYSAAGGLKGNLGGFDWDLGTVYGQSIIDITQSNSDNPSLGLASPTASYRGGTRFKQWTTNLDINRDFPVGDADPLKVAFGLEHRVENYDLVEGDLASYVNGGVAILDGPNAGKPAPVGFQPSAGFSPLDAVKANRHSDAAYAELEKQFFDRLLLTGAARYEDYSDFGSNTTYKLAGRYQLFDSLALRASVGSGFRAPHLAQSYFSSTAVNFINGLPVFVRQLPVSDPSAVLLGSKPLKPEKSTNESAGLVFSQGNLLLSADFYRIKIRDRIAISSTFQDQKITDLLAAAGHPGIGAVSYLTNAVDTVTEGADFTGQYRQDLAEFGSLTATVGANYNKTHFTRIAPTPAPLLALGIATPLFDLTQQIRFTSSAPRDKYIVNLSWNLDRFTVNFNNIRYGKVETVAFSSLTPARIAAVTPGFDVRLAPTDPASANSQVIQIFSAKIISDLEISYRVTDQLSLSVGANNLFDVYPDKNIASTAASVAAGTNGSDNAGIFPYNYVSPWGWNGRFLYMRANFRL